MFAADFDRSQRLLKLTFSDHVTVDELRFGLETIKSLLENDQPGLRVLTDMINLDSMDVSCAPVVADTMDFLREKGVETVARIIPDHHKDIGLEILSLFHYGHSVKTTTVDNLDDAMHYLNG